MIKHAPPRLQSRALAVGRWLAPGSFRVRRALRLYDRHLARYTRQAEIRKDANERLLRELSETYWFLRTELDTEDDAQAVLRNRIESLVERDLLSQQEAKADQDWVLAQPGPPHPKQRATLRLRRGHWHPA